MNEQRLRELANLACAKGMAAIACYGKRDESGLIGTSKKHYEELVAMQEEILCICKAHPKEGFWLDIDCPYHGNRFKDERAEDYRARAAE